MPPNEASINPFGLHCIRFPVTTARPTEGQNDESPIRFSSRAAQRDISYPRIQQTTPDPSVPLMQGDSKRDSVGHISCFMEHGVSNYSYLSFEFNQEEQRFVGFIDIGKDDGLSSDTWLAGPEPSAPGTLLDLVNNSTSLDHGGPVSLGEHDDLLEIDDGFSLARRVDCPGLTLSRWIEPVGDTDFFELFGPDGITVTVDIDAHEFGSDTSRMALSILSTWLVSSTSFLLPWHPE